MKSSNDLYFSVLRDPTDPHYGTVYVAWCEAVPIITDAPTLDELVEGVQTAVDLHFDDPATAELYGFSGKPDVKIVLDLPLQRGADDLPLQLTGLDFLAQRGYTPYKIYDDHQTWVKTSGGKTRQVTVIDHGDAHYPRMTLRMIFLGVMFSHRDQRR